jgi:4-amino-4-deoxy-L-arabinose transferase-like glycosyltransferase
MRGLLAAVARLARAARPPTHACFSRGTWWLLTLVVLIAWFAALDNRKLQHPDEGRYAEIAREMATNGDCDAAAQRSQVPKNRPPSTGWAPRCSTPGVNEFGALAPGVAGLPAVIAVGFTAAGWRGRRRRVRRAGAGGQRLAQRARPQADARFRPLVLFAIALCAFLLAQRPALAVRQRNWIPLPTR